MRRVLIGILSVVGMVDASVAQASSITLNFTGVVNSTAAADIPVGSLISGSYTFESTTADTNAADTTTGVYPAITAFTLSMGPNYNVTGSSGTITVHNSAGNDEYVVDLPATTPVNGVTPIGFELLLFDTSHLAFSSDALPTSLTLSAFNFRAATLVFPTSCEDDCVIEGVLGMPTSLGTPDTTVPEPATLTLLGSGVLAMALRRRRGR